MKGNTEDRRYSFYSLKPACVIPHLPHKINSKTF